MHSVRTARPSLVPAAPRKATSVCGNPALAPLRVVQIKEETPHNKVVDELREEHGSYHEVIETLKCKGTLEKSVRKVALQIANTRLREYAEKLLDETVLVLISPGRDIDDYRVALEKVERAKELTPDDPITQATLGVAQYRVGAYEDALETLRRCEKTSIGYLYRATAA